jgi:chromosome partitioning protein
VAYQIITFINVKGGAGKSTLACCVAAQLSQKHPVTLIDADPQGGASAWHRAGDDLEKVSLIVEAGESAAELAKQASKNSIVIVDLAGFATKTMISTLGVTDTAIIPCRASALDALKTLETESIIQQVREAARPKLKTMVVMNGVTRTVITPHIRAELESSGLTVAKTEIGQRTAYAIAGLNGSAPCYMGSSAKVAANEIKQLTKEILK